MVLKQKYRDLKENAMRRRRRRRRMGAEVPRGKTN